MEDIVKTVALIIMRTLNVCFNKCY